jgi:DNA segregation ATPase FtsK/SpoIIIE, S-DNA-T family
VGPRGLVVVATGSGNSELLCTLVTGLAMTHSPELLSLGVVGGKSGTTFAGLTDLPHRAGMIGRHRPALVRVAGVVAEGR